MGKSLRSSRKKTNKSHLRAKVHQPVEDARTERLSAKLLELAQKPKEEIKVVDEEMAVEHATEREQIEATLGEPEISDEKMDVDDGVTVPKSESKARPKSSKIQKKRKGQKKMVFAVGKVHGKKRSSGKGYKGPGIR